MLPAQSKDLLLMLSAVKAKLLKMLLACMCLVTCSVVDSVIPKDDKPAGKPSQRVVPDPPGIHLDLPKSIASSRLLRRISIDLRSQLPTPEEESWISSGSVSLEALVLSFLS